MIQRDSMGRDVGGGFRMGNMCMPMVDACWCMAKSIQYCKVNNNNNKLKIINSENHFSSTVQWVLINTHSDIPTTTTIQILNSSITQEIALCSPFGGNPSLIPGNNRSVFCPYGFIFFRMSYSLYSYKILFAKIDHIVEFI